ncbi:MAG: MFS transporter [Cytophagaceae bacterium]
MMIAKNNPSVVRSWCLYDWANSVYSLTITTAIFPLYYMGVTKNEAAGNMVDFFGFHIDRSVLFSWAVSIVFLMAACVSPILSAMADATGRKKMFMRISCYVGSLSCASLVAFDEANVTFGICAFVLAGIGYSTSIVFYNSYLPEIATEENFDAYSAKGFSLGYIGSVLLLIVNLVVIMNADSMGITTGEASRLAFLSVGIWWFFFANISFRGLPDVPPKKMQGSLMQNSFGTLASVFKIIKGLPLLWYFLIGFFFYNMGVQTVMYLAPIFAVEVIQVEDSQLIMTILIIQLVAIAGAYVLNRVSSKIGNSKALLVGIVIWIVICVSGYVVQKGIGFFTLAAAIGFVMGGIQSLSRATFSKLIPIDAEEHASYFSFYDVMDKMSIVLGTFSYGLIKDITGDMRNSVVALGLFFLISIIFIYKIPSKTIYNTKISS